MRGRDTHTNYGVSSDSSFVFMSACVCEKEREREREREILSSASIITMVN